MIKSLSGKFAAFAAVAILALSGCTEEGDTVTVNVPNNKQVAKVTYVVQVMEASGMGTDGAAIRGASLRYVNANGQYTSAPNVSDANGNIVLNDVRPGTFTGILTAPEFGEVNFVSDLTKAGNDTAYSAVSRVYMFPQTAGIRGKVYGNYAMNGAAPNPNAATDVQEVEMMLSYKLVKEGSNAYPMGEGPGRLVNLTIVPMTLQTTQSQGATSSFLFDQQVYSTESGMLQAYLSMVPKNFQAGAGSNQRDSVFVLAAGEPRNQLRVNLYRNTNQNPTNIGNLLAKPTTMP